MAARSWPGSAMITRLDMQPIVHQIVHPIEGSNQVQILSTGYGSWEGIAEIGPMEDGAVIEAFLTSMNGAEHYTEMPIYRHTIGRRPTRVQSFANGLMTLDSRPDGVAVGSFFRAGTRCYIFDTVTATGTTFGAWPERPLAIGTIIRTASTMRVRMRGTVNMPVTRGRYGPWTFRWQEAG